VRRAGYLVGDLRQVDVLGLMQPAAWTRVVLPARLPQGGQHLGHKGIDRIVEVLAAAHRRGAVG